MPALTRLILRGFDVWVSIVSLAMLPAGCESKPAGTDATAAGPGLFKDITASLKIPPPAPYPEGQYYTPEITPGGVALFDYDGDADLDIYQVVHPPPARPFSR